MGYELTWESRGAVKRFFGHVTGNDVLQSVINVESDERFDRLRYVINDFLEATGLTVSASELDEIAAIDGAAALVNRNIRIAIVTTNPEIISASDQYAKSPMNAYPTRIFPTVNEARTWLGVDQTNPQQ